MSKKVQFVIWAIILIAVVGLLGGLVYSVVKMNTEGNVHPEVTFEIKDYGNVKMELYPEYAPNTVANFIRLVEKGYYNNKVVYGKDEICLYAGRNSEGEIENPKTSLIFDNVEAGSEYDYDYTIKGEFAGNGFKQNTLMHEKGVVSLIRNDYTQYVQTLSEESYNSGNAQLGIMMGENASNLNGSYAAFGKIVEGMDVLENIYNNVEMKQAEATEGSEGHVTETEQVDINSFANYPVISNATVDTHGINYNDPQVEEAFDYSSYLYNLMSSYSNN